MYKTIALLEVSERFSRLKEILLKLGIFMPFADETIIVNELEVELKRLDEEFK